MALVRNIEVDHTEAVERHGVFGTPTFVFDNGHSVYLKSFIPPDEEAVAFFRALPGNDAQHALRR